MTTPVMAATLLSAIAIICLIDAYLWKKKSQTVYQFFLLGGTLKVEGFLVTIIAANFSLGNFVIFVSVWGFKYGIPGLAFFIVNLVMNYLAFKFFLPGFKDYIENHLNNGTIHDFIAKSYTDQANARMSKGIRLTASLATIIGLLFAITFELSLAVTLLGDGNSVGTFTLFAFLTVLIAGFTAYGGFRTLFTTDIGQSILVILASMSLLLIMFFSDGSTSEKISSLETAIFEPIGWPPVLSILLVGAGWMLISMDQWQRICASRSYDTSIKGTLRYLLPMICFATIYAAWGAYDKSILLPHLSKNVIELQPVGVRNPFLDLPYLSVFGIPTVLISFITSGLIAAAVSTTNTFLTVSSHSFTTDILISSMTTRSIHNLDALENGAFVKFAGALVVAAAVIIVLLHAALTASGLLSDPLKFFYIAYSFQFALLAPVAMTRVPPSFRPSSIAVLLSLWLGLIAAPTIGLGSWLLSESHVVTILQLTPNDWLVLTPVITFVAGLIPLATSSFMKVHTASIDTA